MQPVTVNLPNHTKGDTWEGMTVGPVLFNGGQPDYALSSARLHFRMPGSSTVYKMNESPGAGEGTITIVDEDTWYFTVDATVLPLGVGIWYWDLETTDSNGTIRTLYNGSLEITKEQSY